jgi:hypothetical protein
MAWACHRRHPGQSEPLRLEEISDTVGHVTGTVLRHTAGTLTAATVEELMVGTGRSGSL